MLWVIIVLRYWCLILTGDDMVTNGNTEKSIVGFLRENDDGLTITELVGLSKLSRSTVRVVLARLEGGEKISYRNIGMAKVYHLEGKK